MFNKFKKTFFVKFNVAVEYIIGKSCAAERRYGQNRIVDIAFFTEKGQISTGDLSAVRNSENVNLGFTRVRFDGLNKGIKLSSAGNGAHSEVTVKVKDVFFSDVARIFAHDFGFMLKFSVGIKLLKICAAAFFRRYTVSLEFHLACAVGIARHVAEHIHHFFADGRGDFLGVALRERTETESDIGDSLEYSFADFVHVKTPDMDLFAVFAFFVHPRGRIAGNDNNRIFGIFFSLSR